MKHLLTAVLILLAAGQDVLAAGGQSPIGSPTAVPSSGQSGLVRSQPNMYGVSGNNIMTGNVGGGKEFKGVVPYSSRFYNRSSSSPIDNFLRRSSGSSLTHAQTPGIYDPYYDPRRTVTSLYRGGETGLTAPKLSGQGRASAAVPSGLPQMNNTPFSLQQRPLSSSPQDLSQILNRQPIADHLKDYTGDKKKPAQFAQVKKDILYDPLKPENLLLPQEVLKPAEGMENKKEIVEQDQPDRQEQIREQIRKETEQKELDAAQEKGKQADEQTENKTTTEQDGESELQGRYKTFSDMAEAKASEYMKQAQEFLADGKYYKAADSFALAAVWKPEDANAWIGQVGSLFAAGEYMSSAYYLGQVLTLKPQLIEQKIPQSLLMQKRDTFENGLVEAQTWQERSQSGELAFLLAYMLMQDGKSQRAQDTISRAQILIPESEAIKNLAALINSQLLPSNSLPISPVMPVNNTVKEPNQP